MIRVFLICDDPTFCEKLDNFFNLQHNFQVCGKAPRNLAAVQKAHTLLPDVAIIVANGVHDFKVTDNFKKSMPHGDSDEADQHSALMPISVPG